MNKEHDVQKARDLAEQGIEAGTKGDTAKGEHLVKQAQRIDKKAVDQLAEEIDQDREQAQSYEKTAGEQTGQKR